MWDYDIPTVQGRSEKAEWDMIDVLPVLFEKQSGG